MAARGAIEDTSVLNKEELFAYNYHGLKIKTEDLPENTLKGVSYGHKDAAFVVAWLQGYLSQEIKAKNSFMTGYIEEIMPLKFNLELKQKGQLEATLEFEIEEDDKVELQIKGQLHRNSKGEVGVEWTESTGNSYWVSNVLVGLNGALSELL